MTGSWIDGIVVDQIRRQGSWTNGTPSFWEYTVLVLGGAPFSTNKLSSRVFDIDDQQALAHGQEPRLCYNNLWTRIRISSRQLSQQDKNKVGKASGRLKASSESHCYDNLNWRWLLASQWLSAVENPSNDLTLSLAGLDLSTKEVEHKLTGVIFTNVTSFDAANNRMHQMPAPLCQFLKSESSLQLTHFCMSRNKLRRFPNELLSA